MWDAKLVSLRVSYYEKDLVLMEGSIDICIYALTGHLGHLHSCCCYILAN